MVLIRGEAATSTSAGPTGKKMSEGELKGILNAKVTNSLGYYGGKLSKARVTALQYYNGELFGNELEGRSQVVSRDVAEAIDSMMPALMKIFTSGDEVVRFEAGAKNVPDGTPVQQILEQLKLNEERAKQATDYCNWIWTQQNPGFEIFHNWFKDAMLNRIGAIKIWWDEQEEVSKETYKGLNDEELAYLLRDEQEDKMKLVEDTEYPDPDWVPPPLPQLPAPPIGQPQGAAPMQQPPPALGAAFPGMGHNMPPEPMPPPMLHDVVIRRTNKGGRIRIIPIPGEEFLMDRRAVALERDNPFCAHRSKKTLSDLMEMGYEWDTIKVLGEGDSSDFNLERLERFRQEDELPYRTGNNYDPAMKEIWINECYMNVDYDGDGIAELRKIIFAGESGNFAPGATVILENEEVDDNPFAALTPIPMPHKFYGMSIADQTMDLQLIKSVLFRTVLDHSYSAIMPQMAVVEGQVNLDDLLTRRPGGIVRMKAQGAVEPLPPSQMGVDPFQLIAYIDQVREQRTGVRRFTAGPGADVLENAYTGTATGANLVENSSQERSELVARCFAEIGIKPAFRKILKLVTTHQNKPKIIRLRGKFVPMDPREWDDEFDMTVTVGLGTGNRDQQLKGIAMMLQIDQQIIQMQQGLNGPIVTAENLYNKLAKLCEYNGLKTAMPYYTDPATAPPQSQQQRPDPKMVEAQGKVQAQQALAQAKAQQNQQQSQADIAEQKVRAQVDMAIEQAKAQHELALARQKAFLEAQLEGQKAAHNMQLERMRLDHDRAINEQAASHKLTLDAHMADAKARQMAQRPQANGAV